MPGREHRHQCDDGNNACLGATDLAQSVNQATKRGHGKDHRRNIQSGLLALPPTLVRYLAPMAKAARATGSTNTNMKRQEK